MRDATAAASLAAVQEFDSVAAASRGDAGIIPRAEFRHGLSGYFFAFFACRFSFSVL